MNVHYMEYLEVLDDDRFTRIVLDWIAENPLAAPGSWRIAWNSYALSLRTLVWMQQLATRGDRLEAGFRETACRSLVQQLRFLLRRLETDIGGNHLIKNAKTLLWASRFFAGEEAARWGARRTTFKFSRTCSSAQTSQHRNWLPRYSRRSMPWPGSRPTSLIPTQAPVCSTTAACT